MLNNYSGLINSEVKNSSSEIFLKELGVVCLIVSDNEIFTSKWIRSE